MARGMKRPTDWVVSPNMWHDPGTSFVMTQNLTGIVALSTWPSQTHGSTDTLAFEGTSGYVHERTFGQILVQVSPTQAVDRSRQFFETRIRIGEMEPDSLIGEAIPVLPATYDLRLATVANESFLWHRTTQFWSETNYWAGTAAQANPQWVVDVDCKVKRRIEQYQQVQLVLGWYDYLGSDPLINLNVRLRLRTLLSADGT